MYKIEKRFTLPIGHRLSKNKGRCFSIHGHNFIVLVGIKAKTLNENDMVMDFSDLKDLVEVFLDNLDHCLLLNVVDSEIGMRLKDLGTRVKLLPYDPTAEKLAEEIYVHTKESLSISYPDVIIDYVTVYENENSKATYIED